MRFLPTRAHGVIDYLWGLALILSPFVLGFAGDGAAFWTAMLFGLGAIAYSLVTNYEMGLSKLVPMPVHLGLDAVAGLALAVSPFVTGVSGPPRWLFVLFGLASLAASLVTRMQPERAVAR